VFRAAGAPAAIAIGAMITVGRRSAHSPTSSSAAETSMRNAGRMDGDADVAMVAALFGDPTRAEMLDALLDGGTHAAGELAHRAGVAPSTASEHLMRLLRAGFVLVETHGRERRYRLASPAVGEALEALARIAPSKRVGSLRDARHSEAMRRCRTCYDHLAGRVGVAVTDALVARGTLVAADGAFSLPQQGAKALESLGVDVESARRTRRSFARSCLDWSERRPHLAGALGAALASACFNRGWLERRPHNRALLITPAGFGVLRSELAIELD
jgi:DNA-binding transcriptional ArsR family regulator